ncbi:MAG: TlpA family protein disulfide reductase [Candidatus Kariarchaeaceae archaeon]|jgi:thioredoxin-related protein
MKSLRAIVLFTLIIIVPISGSSFIVPYKKLDGTKASLADYGDGFLFVEAFTTWCDSCKLEMEQLQIVWEYTGNQIKMLSLSVDTDTDTLEKITEYKDEFNAEWEFGLDYTNMFEEKYDVRVYPSLYLFNSDGALIEMWWGFTKASKILTDMNNHFNVSLNPDDLNEEKEYMLFANALVSNPMFIITMGFVMLNLVVLLKSKRNRKSMDVKHS